MMMLSCSARMLAIGATLVAACSATAAGSGDGITWEQQQTLALGPPLGGTAQRVGRGVLVCWQAPPAPTVSTPGVDAVVVRYRVYRRDAGGRLRAIGSTTSRCFFDAGAGAFRAAHVVVAITRSGQESEQSDIIAPP